MRDAMASTRVGPSPGHPSVEELASQILRKGRSVRIKARGSSMTPFLRDGDIAFITPADGQGVRVGDVVCYEAAPARLVLHRVVGRHGASIVAKGDALSSAELIVLSQILGVVRAIERRGRVRWLDTAGARGWNRLLAFLSPAISRLVPLAVGVRRLARAVCRA
jgi:hypothetical protein